LTGATYAFASTKTAHRVIPIVWAGVVALAGGFGIFMFLAIASVGRCLD